MSMSDLPDLNPSYAFQTFRAISMPSMNNSNSSTDIAKLAEDKVVGNSSALATELKDFTSIMAFHGSDTSCINSKDMEKASSKSVFYGKKAKEVADKVGYISQCSIFQQNIKNDGGLRYANIGANIKQSAIDFASADIAAIENAFQILQKTETDDGPHKEWRTDHGKVDGKLTAGEIRSLKHGIRDNAFNKNIQMTDLDGERGTISISEYASYIIAADSIYYDEETKIYGYDVQRADGIITEEESLLLKDINDNMLHEFAQNIHDNYVTNRKAGKKDKAW